MAQDRKRQDHPQIRVLNVSGGVQSTAMLLLSARGDLPKIDYAVFADNGWEPAEVHQQLDRLETEVCQPAGIPLLRVPTGDIREDILSSGYVSMPVHVLTASGTRSVGKRQCSGQYKTRPLFGVARRLLGGAAARGPVPGGRWAEMWLGISTDEAQRAEHQRGRAYAVYRWPLLELGLSRQDCHRINVEAGFEAPHTACIGCPFHSDSEWRRLRDTRPAEWAQAVEFDRAIRDLPSLRGQAFLHRSLRPLGEAPIDMTEEQLAAEHRVAWLESAAGGLTKEQVERLARVVSAGGRG